jgi:DNA repair protein RadA/Sms
MGRCSDCGEWNTLEELEITKTKGKTPRRQKQSPGSTQSGLTPITEVPRKGADRIQLGVGELDRVLGGGLVIGSLILLGGDPGVGKSTMASRVSACMARLDKKVLYVSGEESMHQTRMRAERINCLHENIFLFSEVEMDRIQDEVHRSKPDLLVVDSIQSVYCPELPSTPGTVTQLRETTGRLMFLAKKGNVPTLLIGHVTKDGAIAGPRILEHMVDTVLYFEGERGHPYRILRSVKNRFGSTNEIGVFEMKEEGLVEIDNPSKLFLEQRPNSSPGSVVTISIEGTRPLLVEVQALIGSSSYGTPRRTCTGVDHNRVALLTAILEKHGGLHLNSLDIFVNVAGGFKLVEPAADLAVSMALVSSFRNKSLPLKMAMFGEIGLTGEVRAVSQAEARIHEAIKLGFTQVMLPENNRKRIKSIEGVELIGVRTVDEMLSFFSS